MLIQVIEDDERMASFLKQGLIAHGLAAETFFRGDAALAAWAEGPYDLVILDLELPDQNGLEVLKALREGGNSVPVLILTSRGQVGDRVEGLDAGADDYMAKPFDITELVARVNALLRRPADVQDRLLKVGNLTFDAIARETRVDDVVVLLTSRETALLERLMRQSGRLLRKQVLEREFYASSGDQAGKSMDVLLYRLRRKLEAAGTDVVIRTMRGMGYVLSPAPEEE